MLAALLAALAAFVVSLLLTLVVTLVAVRVKEGLPGAPARAVAGAVDDAAAAAAAESLRRLEAVKARLGDKSPVGKLDPKTVTRLVFGKDGAESVFEAARAGTTGARGSVAAALPKRTDDLVRIIDDAPSAAAGPARAWGNTPNLIANAKPAAPLVSAADAKASAAKWTDMAKRIAGVNPKAFTGLTHPDVALAKLGSAPVLNKADKLMYEIVKGKWTAAKNLADGRSAVTIGGKAVPRGSPQWVNKVRAAAQDAQRVSTWDGLRAEATAWVERAKIHKVTYVQLVNDFKKVQLPFWSRSKPAQPLLKPKPPAKPAKPPKPAKPAKPAKPVKPVTFDKTRSAGGIVDSLTPRDWSLGRIQYQDLQKRTNGRILVEDFAGLPHPALVVHRLWDLLDDAISYAPQLGYTNKLEKLSAGDAATYGRQYNLTYPQQWMYERMLEQWGELVTQIGTKVNRSGRIINDGTLKSIRNLKTRQMARMYDDNDSPHEWIRAMRDNIQLTIEKTKYANLRKEAIAHINKQTNLTADQKAQLIKRTTVPFWEVLPKGARDTYAVDTATVKANLPKPAEFFTNPTECRSCAACG